VKHGCKPNRSDYSRGAAAAETASGLWPAAAGLTRGPMSAWRRPEEGGAAMKRMGERVLRAPPHTSRVRARLRPRRWTLY
jgi:hypothetical protein